MATPRIVPRATWGARRPKATPSTVPIRTRTATCIHHDGPTPITVKTHEQAYALMRRDQTYHMDGQGWIDIGYNFLVISAAGTPVDGMIMEGRGRDAIGAHCAGWNTPWIGIQCAIGGGQTPSAAALASIRWLHDTLEAAAGHQLAMKVHSDGFATACPDPKLRAWVKAGMPVKDQPTQPPPPPPPIKPPPTQEQTMADLTLTNPLTREQASAATGLNSIWAYSVKAYQLQVEAAKKVGVDVDEKAIAAAVVASMAAPLKAAVAAAVTAGGSPEAIADAVVARMAAALA